MIFKIKSEYFTSKKNVPIQSIKLQGAKNSMLNNLCLPLLSKEPFIIDNVPRIKDIEINLEYLKTLGATVKFIEKNKLLIQCDNITNISLDPSLSTLTTGSKFFIPLMLYRFDTYKTGCSIGCNIGDRGFENYINSLKDFGIFYTKEENGIYSFYKEDIDIKIKHLSFPSFGLTINAIFAAISLKKDITITNTCLEPEIDNTIELINKMGINIYREEKSILIKNTNNIIKGCSFRNMSDRNVAVTYAVLALITNNNLIIDNYDNIKMEAFYDFLNTINANYKIDNNQLIIYKSNIREYNGNDIRIKAFLYPDFHSDWQPLIAPLLTQLMTNSYIEEHLFQDRLKYWEELGKFGIKFNYDFSNKTRFANDTNPHAVYIYGKQKLVGTQVFSRDLRGGMSLLIASAIAQGVTFIDNAEEILRGYENVIDNFKKLSINITVYDKESEDV